MSTTVPSEPPSGADWRTDLPPTSKHDNSLRVSTNARQTVTPPPTPKSVFHTSQQRSRRSSRGPRPQFPSGLSPEDFGGWAGDLITVGAKFVESGRPASEAYQLARDRMGINVAVVASTYSEEDYIQDIDAVLVGSALLGTPNASISNLLTNIVGSNGNYRQGTTLFRQMRSGGTSATLKVFLKEGGGVMSDVPPQVLRDIADAWWQTTQDRIAAE